MEKKYKILIAIGIAIVLGITIWWGVEEVLNRNYTERDYHPAPPALTN